MLRSFFITFLIAILFGKENTQNMFVVFFAKGVADKEENQRSADADNYIWCRSKNLICSAIVVQ